MTVREAARALGTTTRTVHRMIARGELDACKAYAGLRAPYLITCASVETAAEHYPRAS